MDEFFNVFGWGMITLTSTKLILLFLKILNNFVIPQNVMAVFFVPFVVTIALTCAKIIPLL